MKTIEQATQDVQDATQAVVAEAVKLSAGEVNDFDVAVEKLLQADDALGIASRWQEAWDEGIRAGRRLQRGLVARMRI